VPEKSLPIWEIHSQIVDSLRVGNRLILSAPTGSGKTTQVPQMLLQAGLLGEGQVVILQPRRLAARLLAARVAQELGVKLGREVGYQIRFENVTSPETKIRFVTEGVLLRQMIDDPQLKGVSVLLFDEFHERHLYGDITLARALDVQESSRPDLRLAVMSATLDADLLAQYLKPRVLTSEGRTFPVEIKYAADPSYNDKRPIWDQAADAFSRYVNSGGEGDVLVFMPGGFEISQTIEAIRHTDEAKGFILLPLHGELPPNDQDAAVARYPQRKVVVSTNVAETSLTIDGVQLVIDSGLARIPRFDANRGINTLLVEKISQSSADQRAGRAGRTAPGVCMRLWSRDEHAHRPAQELPEIKRLDLTEVVLTLKAAGIENLRKFRWLEPPDEQSLAHAEELLTDLGALDKNGSITTIGRKMLAFPLHPRYARMLLAAQEYGCVYQAALVAALTQGRDLLLRNVGRETNQLREDLLGEKASSDFWILMRAWTYASKNQFRMDACRKLGIHAVTARQVGPLFDHFLRIAKKEGLDVEPHEVKDEALQKCVLIGFSDRVAARLDQGTLRCELVHNRRGVLARESVVQHAPLFVAAEVREVEGKDEEVRTILSLATAIETDWLRELFPGDIQGELKVQFDPTQKRVVAAELSRFRGLALSAKRVEPPPAEAAARLLAEEVIAGHLVLKEWDHTVEQWILRLNLLSKWCPELELPPITDDDRRHLIEQVCHGAIGYKDIKDRDVRPIVQSWLSQSQRDLLDKHAPERLSLPNGRAPKVSYEASNPPHIAMRIQELYDVTQTPKIALGRAPVLVHILTPGMKPVQVTQDLANFWREHYPKIKSELQRRYPKHEWR
jgi:ATP-dependent helicase HrpB